MSSHRIMISRDVAALVILCLLISPVDLLCDDNDTRKLFRENFCQLPKVVGSCKLKWKRFYFNRFTQQCEQFVYEGKVKRNPIRRASLKHKKKLSTRQDVRATETISRPRPIVNPVADRPTIPSPTSGACE
jgi:Kunitz/Bovine pancreatic trypsin inhibitor domain